MLRYVILLLSYAMLRHVNVYTIFVVMLYYFCVMLCCLYVILFKVMLRLCHVMLYFFYDMFAVSSVVT